MADGFASFLQVPNPKDWLQQLRQNVRPWLLFVQMSNFKTPRSVPRLGQRIMHNVKYFLSNYVFVFLGLLVYCLITSPLILLVIWANFCAGYGLAQIHKKKKLVLFGNELTLAQQYGLVFLCFLCVYYLVGAHAAMFWALEASFYVTILHAVFYNITQVQYRSRGPTDIVLILDQRHHYYRLKHHCGCIT